MLLAVPVLALMVHLPVTVLPVRGEVAFWVTRVASAGAVPVAKQVVPTQGTSPVTVPGENVAGLAPPRCPRGEFVVHAAKAQNTPRGLPQLKRLGDRGQHVQMRCDGAKL